MRHERRRSGCCGSMAAIVVRRVAAPQYRSRAPLAAHDGVRRARSQVDAPILDACHRAALLAVSPRALLQRPPARAGSIDVSPARLDIALEFAAELAAVFIILMSGVGSRLQPFVDVPPQTGGNDSAAMQLKHYLPANGPRRQNIYRLSLLEDASILVWRLFSIRMPVWRHAQRTWSPPTAAARGARVFKCSIADCRASPGP